MASQPGTLERLAQELGLALQPLEQRLAAGQFRGFLHELGIALPDSLASEAQFIGAVGNAATKIGELAPLIAQLADAISSDNTAQIISTAIQALAKAGEVFDAFSQVSVALHAAASSAAGLTPAQQAQLQALALELATKLFDYAVIEYLKTKGTGVIPTLNLIGLVDTEIDPGTPGDPTAPPFQKHDLHFDRIFDLLLHPDTYLKETFGWGDPSFDGSLLLPRVDSLISASRLPVTIIRAPGQPPILEAFLLRLTADKSVSPPGLAARIRIDATEDFSQNYQLGALWALALSVSARFGAGMEADIAPLLSVTLRPPSGTVNITAKGGLLAQHADGTPLILLGQTGGSRLEAKSMGAALGLAASWDPSTSTAKAEPTASVDITGGNAVIDTSNADGFIGAVTQGIHVEAGFDLHIDWQPDTGVHITGGAQIEVDLPLHLDLGPITIATLYLVGGLGNDGLTLEISVALGITLGPIAGSVDRIGAKALLGFPDHGGNLGRANLSVAFKPPNGLGLEIDAGVVAGGGYISFDPDKGEYAGVLDVSLAEIVQVKVIGVLDTKLPDGSKGYSLLLIITFDFPPIELGLGFTLNGVGGIGGVNRTMSIDALHAAFRAHTLNNIMFPPDPVKNAPQIISEIHDLFPPANGRYLFGPMLEFGWGTPTLITLSVGVILEVPDPIRLAILGLIDAGLPTTEAALIELHIDVLGTVDFGTKQLSIDGSLYDSHVLIFALAGDLALRLSWGDDPNFVFSLGGFNPHFNTAGLDVPANMHRMSVSIGDGDNPRISANAYFAITSNSLQFGANVEAYASAAGFTIHGYLGFDVLIIYSPFSFEFDFSAGFQVSFEGLTLLGLQVDGVLSGPRPWHIHGDASIQILFFSVSVSLDITWGDPTAVVLPAKPVLPDLIAALQDPRNWSAQLPDRTTQAVSFSAPKPDDKTLRVHPIGKLAVRENVVPLDLQITKYGNATPSDGTYFSINSVAINGQAEPTSQLTEYFGAAQFLTLSDADKMSRPSFEKFDAGKTIASDAIAAGADSARTVVYEERYIDTPSGFSRFGRLYAMSASIHASLVRQGAGYLSAVKNTGLAKFNPPVAAKPVTNVEPAYVVAGIDDLALRTDIVSSTGTTYFAARAALDSFAAANPDQAASLQIIPVHEALAA